MAAEPIGAGLIARRPGRAGTGLYDLEGNRLADSMAQYLQQNPGSFISGSSGGGGAYGTVPQPTTNPNPYPQFNAVYPTLPQATTTANQVVQQQMEGRLTDAEKNAVIDATVARNFARGFQGSDFSEADILATLGRTTGERQQQGLQNFQNILGTYQQNLVGPATQLEQENRLLASAPDPRAAALEQQRLYLEQLNAQAQLESQRIAQQFQLQADYLSRYLNQSQNIAGGGGRGTTWASQRNAGMYDPWSGWRAAGGQR